MKVLVTGAKGFIARNLIKKLKEEGYEGIGLEQDILKSDNWEKELFELINGNGIEYIFHVGAISDTSLQDSKEMFNCNYVFSKRLFDIAQLLHIKVIYSSSAACDGDGDGLPNNIYGWSKLLAEEYGMLKCDDFVSLRYFNVYGPGEEHKGKMSSVALQSWNGEISKLFPKKPKRDFVYVDDVVSANIHAMHSPTGVYEVGSGDARTFEDVLDRMDLPYKYHSKDKIPEWYQFYTKSDKSKWLPEWEPKYNLELGIKKYMEYLNK
jgi:ADP-L-glycero-D-manno-heptose 6-epimerase